MCRLKIRQEEAEAAAKTALVSEKDASGSSADQLETLPMDPPQQIVKAEPVEQDKELQNLQALSIEGAVAPFLDPEQESADSTYVDEMEEQFEEEVNPDGDDPEVQPNGYWLSPTRYVQFAKRVESESSREDENPPVQKENDQDHELADAVPSDNEKKEVGQMLAETTAALEVGAMDSGDLRRQQLSMRSSEQQKREEAKEEKKKEKETQKKGEAKPKGRPKKLQVEDKKAEEPCHPPDAPKRLRKRQKSVPDLADQGLAVQGLAVEAPAEEAAPKIKPRPKRSTAKAVRGSAEVGAAEVEVAAGSFAPEVLAAAECLPAKKKRRKGLRKKPAQSVEKKELEPEVEQAARSAEVVAEAPPKKKKKTKGKKDKAEEEVVAEAPPKKKKKTKGKKDPDKEAEAPPLAEDEERAKKRMKDTGGRRSRAEPPGTVDEDLKKEMVALLEKWQGKEYDRNEDTYHYSDEFGEAISFTVYWNRPAVGIKIWDYEEKEWTQRAYFAKYSLTLCIFMARKFALQLFQKGLDWGTKDEGIAFRNDLKATAAAAEDALSSM